MRQLTSFQRDVLFVIAGLEREMDDLPKGVDVRSGMTEYRQEAINLSQLYQNLDVLVDDGYVIKSSLDGRSNGHELTPVAETELHNRLGWMADRMGVDL